MIARVRVAMGMSAFNSRLTGRLWPNCRRGRREACRRPFSFKAGTDDLRESPTVVLIETLIGKGIQVSIYDRDVSLARLFGANKEYIEHEIPHISQLMLETIDDVLDHSDIIVIGNGSAEFRQVDQKLSANQSIIDLVRLFDKTSSESYQGICW